MGLVLFFKKPATLGNKYTRKHIIRTACGSFFNATGDFKESPYMYIRNMRFSYIASH